MDYSERELLLVADELRKKYVKDELSFDILCAAVHEYTKNYFKPAPLFKIDAERSLAFYKNGFSVNEIVEVSYFLQIRNGYNYLTDELRDAVIAWRAADMKVLNNDSK